LEYENWYGTINEGEVSTNGQYSYIINVVDEMDILHAFKGDLLLQK
jgi:hypothetical protein|tara:strand:+ start:10558 stop:10695 length:138 start_codon:yes stop_codon:yes gene_type:complete